MAEIKSGLYRHYKGKLYRVLFTAAWFGTRESLKPNTPISIYVQPRLGAVVVSDVTHGNDVFKAFWSGNGEYRAESDEAIVVYVALYDNGRVSARTVWEFEERVAVDGFSSSDVARFERIGD